MSRVLIRTQAWGNVQDAAGDALPSLTFVLKNTDGTAATHWSAETGGTASTASLLTDAHGGATLSGADRWIEAAEYDLTVNGNTYRVQAVAVDLAAVKTHGARGDGSTNDLTAVQQAMTINADGRITLTPGTYVIDGGGPGGNSLTLDSGSSYLSIVGLGNPEDIIIKLAPENASASGNFQLFTKTRGQSITFRNVTLQGPSVLGNGGAPADPASPGSATWASLIGETGSATLGGAIRFINCRVKNFSFVGASGSTSSYEAFYTRFQGYGNTYRSMGPAAGDDGTTGQDPSKHVWLDHCRVSGFGDPAGGNKYHSMYVGTSMAVVATSSIFDSPASTSTGNMLQHYDSNVALTNAATHAVYDNCYFAPGTQGGVLTSYNCHTKFVDCTFDNLANPGISIAGPTTILAGTFNLAASTASAIATTTQGQSSGLDWGFQLGGGSRIKYLTGAGAATGINVTNGNATSEFSIGGDTVFEGAASGAGIYVSMSSAVTVNARINVGVASFHDHPNYAIRTFGQGTVNVAGARMLLTGGTCIGTATNSLARLAVTDTEFSGSGTIFQLTAVPTVTDVARNYGTQWASTIARNVQNGTYTVQPYDEFVVTNATGGFTKTLPAAASVPVGKQFTFLNATSAASSDTIQRAGSDTIGVTGATSVTVATGGAKVTLRAATSTLWDVVG